jgi:4-aminobutyrate aminotransferase/(S)-3-amino-2-methylpropionate transaminase
MRARMVGWSDRFDEIGDVRGLGAMLAIELVHDRVSKNPAPELVTAVCDAAFRNGLLLLSAGIYSNVVRVLVPLTISDAELEEALSVWEQALEQALSASG